MPDSTSTRPPEGDTTPTDAERFAREAEGASSGIVREFWDFLRYNKKWWLTPIIVVLVLLGVLVILSSTAAAPFIYTLF
jgi:hypothetical protein